ncbi:MAG: zinc ABC transporter substrate-binding protein [Rhodospirillales bacterium]|nr:zinc ABC transporter substrate-binding protein [Rhodospirillales bacterium]
MSRTFTSLAAFTTVLMSGTALADVPNVTADIAPVHSLVARVMDGVGTPSLIVQSGATPHGYTLRPSEAEALQEADLVFWMGEDLTPWMDDAIGTLAAEAHVTTLLEADGTVLLDGREGALFEAHAHDDHAGHDSHDDHDDDHAGHDSHDDHDDDHADHDSHDDHDDDHADHDSHDDHDDDHADHDGHDDHDDDHADHDGHDDHGEHDPHAWLSPRNAGTWLTIIAAGLSQADPDNADTYQANAAEAREELEALSTEISATLDPVRGGSFIVFHDAYQYFETDFDVPASGAISLGDASDPSPARIAEIQGRVQDEGIDCVLSEPQFNPGLVATVLDGTDANTGVMDPLGADLEPGPELYPQLLRNMANTLADCL